MRWLKLAAVFCLTAVMTAAVSVMEICAAGYVSGAASWKSGTKDGQADLSVQLVRQQGMGDITALQVNVAMDTDELSDITAVDFTFDSSWGSVVKEAEYDEARGLLTIVIAGTGRIMDYGNIRKLGTLKVSGGKDLRAVINGGEIVADGELRSISFVQDSAVVLYKSSGSGSSSGGTGGGSGSYRPSSGGSSSRGTGPTGRGSGEVYQTPMAEAVETDGDWEQSGSSWKYRLSAGVYAKNTWIFVSGLWYHIGSGGLMDTGWYQEGGTWYFLRPDGHMKKGWLEDNGAWYYLQEDDGKMRTGWLYSGGYWYYMSSSGAMCSGWQIIDNKYYYFNAAAPTAAGQRPLGAMYASAVTPDGYAVDSVGVWQNPAAQDPTSRTPVSPTGTQNPAGPVSPSGTQNPAGSLSPSGTQNPGSSSGSTGTAGAQSPASPKSPLEP